MFRFTEKQMDVFWHQDITEDAKLVTLARLFQDVEEGEARVVVVEVGKTLIAAKGNEVIVSVRVKSLQLARHEVIVNPSCCASLIAKNAMKAPEWGACPN